MPVKKTPLALLLLGVLVLTSSALAAGPMPAPNETRARAMETVSHADTGPALDELLQLARQGDEQALLRQIRRHESGGDWLPAARDALLHALAANLGDLPAGSVGPAVLDHLETIEPTTFVPHFDHPQVGVPLFNIRAAAAGSRNRWHYEEARSRSARLLATSGTPAWFEQFHAESRPGRLGMVDSLADLGHQATMALGAAASADLETDPALTAIVLRCAILTRDVTLFRSAMLNGAGPDLAPALRSFTETFSAEYAVLLAREAIASAAPVNAALVLAELAPELAPDPAMTDLLFDTLSHPELGAAASMALARHPDLLVRERLQALAASDDGLAARRAALALALPATAEGAE